MFQIVAVPMAAYRELPSPAHRWLLQCLAAYADRDGRCWPSMRRLADDARMSLATVCRRLAEMARLGVFQRERRGRGVYRYRLAEAYCPQWPGRVSARQERVSARQERVSQGAKQVSNYTKHIKISGKIREPQPDPPEMTRAERLEMSDALGDLVGMLTGRVPWRAVAMR